MAYDEGLGERIRSLLSDVEGVTERQMFGGLAFMVRGNMACGVIDDQLMARVGPDAYDDALANAHASPMDFTGRPLKGYVYIDPAGIAEDDALAAWVGRTLSFNRTLPAK